MKQQPEQISAAETTKLPTPKFGEDNIGTSIFKNPFQEEENAKQAILEKHVKMVNARDNIKTLNGKKICWNYRKGRCRFGTKCTFAHDSDIQKTSDELNQKNKIQETILFENEVETKLIEMKGKKRPGLSQGLVPGKKVMKMYKKQNTNL